MSLERPQRRPARSPTRPAHSKDTRYSLYVSGLSPKVTEDDLYEHFAKEGKVYLSSMCRLVLVRMSHDIATLLRSHQSAAAIMRAAVARQLRVSFVTALCTRDDATDRHLPVGSRPQSLPLFANTAGDRLCNLCVVTMLQVTESRIVSDPRTYESRGFGFIGYATEQVLSCRYNRCDRHSNMCASQALVFDTRQLDTRLFAATGAR